MRIGSDLDNTLVCYTSGFQIAAAQRGVTVKGKEKVKKEILRKFSEQEWTKIQGEVYGEHIHKCEAFPGVLEFFSRRKDIKIISHKTKFGLGGQDLRKAATTWLTSNMLLEEHSIQYARTRDLKVELIKAAKLDVFIDDLPEIYEHKEFPTGTQFILFDPDNTHSKWLKTKKITSWQEIALL